MGTVCQRSCNGNPLLLTARKRVNSSFLKALKINKAKHIGNNLPDFLLGLFLKLRAECYIFIHIQMRKKSITLKNGVNLSFVRRNIINSFTLENNISAVRLNKACYTAQSCGFTAPGGSQQRYKLFFVDIQIQFVKHNIITVFNSDVLKVDYLFQFPHPLCNPI